MGRLFANKTSHDPASTETRMNSRCQAVFFSFAAGRRRFELVDGERLILRSNQQPTADRSANPKSVGQRMPNAVHESGNP